MHRIVGAASTNYKLVTKLAEIRLYRFVMTRLTAGPIYGGSIRVLPLHGINPPPSASLSLRPFLALCLPLHPPLEELWRTFPLCIPCKSRLGFDAISTLTILLLLFLLHRTISMRSSYLRGRSRTETVKIATPPDNFDLDRESVSVSWPRSRSPSPR